MTKSGSVRRAHCSQERGHLTHIWSHSVSTQSRFMLYAKLIKVEFLHYLTQKSKDKRTWLFLINTTTSKQHASTGSKTVPLVTPKNLLLSWIDVLQLFKEQSDNWPLCDIRCWCQDKTWFLHVEFITPSIREVHERDSHNFDCQFTSTCGGCGFAPWLLTFWSSKRKQWAPLRHHKPPTTT